MTYLQSLIYLNNIILILFNQTYLLKLVPNFNKKPTFNHQPNPEEQYLFRIVWLSS